MVNSEFLNRLANHIEASPYPFAMTAHVTCILGHAHQMEPDLIRSVYATGDFSMAAGLTPTQTGDVIYMLGGPGELGEGNRKRAVEMLRHLAITGEVVWKLKDAA